MVMVVDACKDITRFVDVEIEFQTVVFSTSFPPASFSCFSQASSLHSFGTINGLNQQVIILNLIFTLFRISLFIFHPKLCIHLICQLVPFDE